MDFEINSDVVIHCNCELESEQDLFLIETRSDGEKPEKAELKTHFGCHTCKAHLNQ